MKRRKTKINEKWNLQHLIFDGLFDEGVQCKGGCFSILEGGYNHKVVGKNVLTFIEGLQY